METTLSTMNTIIDRISLVLAIIAKISLLLGSIGMMNIMLVSVTERTREIGLRKALGATNCNIHLQFFIESILACLIGEIIGILLGTVSGHLGSSLIGVRAVPTLQSIAIAFGFAFAIGIFFEFYPASRAAKLNLIDALQYE